MRGARGRVVSGASGLPSGPAIAALVAVLFGLVPAAASPARAEPIPALVLTGAHNHDWEYTSRAIAELLEGTGHFAVTVTADPAAALVDPAVRERTRLYVVDYNGPRWGSAAEQALEQAIGSGAGLVIVHAANNAFAGWTTYERMVGLCWRDEAGHGRFHEFDVVVCDRNHPVTCAMPDLRAHPDELYHGLTRMPDSGLRVLMQAHSSRASGGSGEVEPLVMIGGFGRGRIFHTALGHVWPGQPETRASFEDPGFRLLLARGAEWAATGACSSQAADFGLALDRPSPPRDPWVFRCVLDGRPRALVTALAATLWVAYDTRTGVMTHAWGGSVLEEGAVHTGVHGPQPLTVGAPYLRVDGESRPGLVDAGAATTWSWRYRGHRFEQELLMAPRVWVLGEFRAEGTDGPARTVLVEESPEADGDCPPTLVRRFRVSGLTGTARVQVPLGTPVMEGITVEGAGELSEELAGVTVLLASGQTTVTIPCRLRERP